MKYHLMSSMLLNELKKLHERCESQDAENRDLEGRLEHLEGPVAALSTDHGK